jgi:hypothetical protein
MIRVSIGSLKRDAMTVVLSIVTIGCVCVALAVIAHYVVSGI